MGTFSISTAMYTPPFNHILVKPVSLEHRTIVQQETAPRLLGNLICCRRTVQYDLGKDAVCSSADAASEVCTDLPGDQVRVRSLRARIRWIPKARTCRAIMASLLSICPINFFCSAESPVLSSSSATSSQAKIQRFNGIFTVLLYWNMQRH